MSDHTHADVKSSEAVDKAAEAAAAVEVSRAEQIYAANLESEKRIEEAFIKALKAAFKADDTDSGQKKFIDITRIPLICKDISQMQKDIEAMRNNTTWAVRIVIGAVILALIGLLLK